MQSDDLDKKIQEAADKHHPTYDESAWNKMQRLLDEHLPQKKDDKRRITFFLLLFLMLSLGTYILISKPWVREEKVSKTAAGNSDEKTQDLSAAPDQKSPELNSAGKQFPLESQKNISTPSPVVRQSNARPTTILNNKKKGKESETLITAASPRDPRQSSAKRDEKNIIISGLRADEKNAASGNNNNQTKDPVSLPDKMQGSDRHPDKDTSVINSDEVRDKKPTNETDSEMRSEDQESSVSSSRKVNKTRNTSAFGLTISAGPEFSAVHFNNKGRLTLSYGAGFSYSLKRFTLRSGIYINKKIYSADSSDYHPPAGYWLYNNKLERVDADCRVYEIPLSISYNFIQKQNSNWFASLGLSSYLMKSETYDYLYKNPAGQYRSYDWTLKNKNNHFFSVITISGGYQHKLSNTFSIMAEPYFKLPLQGIGFGKVKLKSAGVLVTVGIRPFNSSK